MDVQSVLSGLLLVAWLTPLASFVVILFTGTALKKSWGGAGFVATGAIMTSFLLSMAALFVWLGENPLPDAHRGSGGGHDAHARLDSASHRQGEFRSPFRFVSQTEESDGKSQGADEREPAAGLFRPDDEPAHEEAAHSDTKHDAGKSDTAHGRADRAPAGHSARGKPEYYGDWYTLGEFGAAKTVVDAHGEKHEVRSHRITIGYYIDALTIAMFCMVTLIATCIHFYANGYMHDELHDITDHEVKLADGHHLHRPGRFHRFFQYLSLFCFSMLGLVIAGNIAMVFVFWELVGICSYFLIGFYIERKSASTAANKAFIVNRVGDFGMIIGLMALWGALGTFSFGGADGLFEAVRPESQGHAMIVPASMSKWLLIVAGLGIFCGCVGKSAQFPLHVWLPDAMEGPTPVSALVHSATMVAAGVYLVGRFYPMFTSEVLLTIAYIGAITLFIAATIAITATDIKRVLAYSTVSQLGFMMLALGVGGWMAGMFHLITHAFFKSLLFMCSGSVIHACHTNEMPKMGGLRKKMPWTAYTMLVGCLAIAGAPFMSGFYSKDAIIAQAMSFQATSPQHSILFYAPAVGAAITAFYMFRLWYMTFAGKPRDHHIYDHAHESPKVMYVPLVVLSVFAIGVGWSLPFTDLSVENMLEQARPLGTLAGFAGVIPGEHGAHAFHGQATLLASGVALAGFVLATLMYGVKLISPDDARKMSGPLYGFLVKKWYFDELYHAIFVRPTHWIAAAASSFDKQVLDGLIHGSAHLVRAVSSLDDWFDRLFVDGLVNLVAACTYAVGGSLRRVQTGKLRQYVMLIVVGTVALLLLIRFGMNVFAG